MDFLNVFQVTDLAKLSSEQLNSLPIVDIHASLLQEQAENIPSIIQNLSDEKFKCLIELTSWNNDKFDVFKYATWLKIITVLPPYAVLRELRRMDKEELKLFLYNTLNIDWYNPEEIYEGEAALTLDNVFIMFPKDGNLDSELSNLAVNIVNAAYLDGIVFGRELCIDTMGLLYSIAEDDSFNLKNSRLSDEGIPAYLEALELFHYENPTKLLQKIIKMIGKSECKKHSPSYDYQISSFTIISKSFWDEIISINSEIFDMLKIELSALLTASIVVNNALDKDADYIKGIVERSKSYFLLGLELVLEEIKNKYELNQIFEYVKLRNLFRLGFSLLIDLKKNAGNVSVAIKNLTDALSISADEEEFLNNLLLPIPMYKPYLNSTAQSFEKLSQLKDARAKLSSMAAKIVNKQ